MAAEAPFKAILRPDGTIEFQGPMHEVLIALERRRAMLASPSLPPSQVPAPNIPPAPRPVSQAMNEMQRHAVHRQYERMMELQRTLRQYDDINFQNEARSRLVKFLDERRRDGRAFRTAEAMESWAGRVIPSVDRNGEQSPLYAKVHTMVKGVIDSYAAGANAPITKFRAGRGAGFKFVSKPDAAAQAEGSGKPDGAEVASAG